MIIKSIRSNSIALALFALATALVLSSDNQPSQGTSASRFLGKNESMAEFTVRGEIIAAGAQPYRFFMLQKVQDEYLKFSESDKLSVSDLLEQCGLKELLDIKLKQRLAQVDNLEVWL